MRLFIDKIKFRIYMKALITCFFIVTQTPNVAAQILSPRLWEVRVTEGEIVTTSYLLAATHLGLPVEYDNYFDSVVLPSFKKSDSLSFEGAGNGDEEPLPLCPTNDLSDEQRKTLEKMRNIVAERFERINLSKFQKNDMGRRDSAEALKKIAASYVDSLDDFSLIQLNRGLIVVENESVNKAGKYSTKDKIYAAELRADVARGPVIAELIKIRPNLRKYDLDTKYGARRAYCSAGPARIDILKREIEGSSIDLHKNPIEELSREFTDLLKSNGSSPQSLADLGLNGKSIMCRRNMEWAEKISSIHDGGTHFYVVGGAHMFNYRKQDASCDGLLTILEKKSAQITLMRQ